MPSAFEGLGIVIIEAQAAGLNCLVSDVVPQEANCGGVYYMSLSKDFKEWAEVMSQMIEGGIELKISEDKIQEFSVNHMVEQMEKVFKKYKVLRYAKNSICKSTL
jgi:glycosyltransferase EpsF